LGDTSTIHLHDGKDEKRSPTCCCFVVEPIGRMIRSAQGVLSLQQQGDEIQAIFAVFDTRFTALAGHANVVTGGWRASDAGAVQQRSSFDAARAARGEEDARQGPAAAARAGKAVTVAAVVA